MAKKKNDEMDAMDEFEIALRRKQPSELMMDYMRIIRIGFSDSLFSDIWLGVSVENQAAADERIPLLLKTPAAVHFVSCEPMLGPVDLSRYLRIRYECYTCGFSAYGKSVPWTETSGDCLQAMCPNCENTELYCDEDVESINWVICGGETGPGARPMHPKWARDLRYQCAVANVPFFFKQQVECPVEHRSLPMPRKKIEYRPLEARLLVPEPICGRCNKLCPLYPSKFRECIYADDSIGNYPGEWCPWSECD